MTHSYNITGITCNNCVAKIKSELLKLGDVQSAEVQAAAPQAVITMQNHIPLAILQSALNKAGAYSITEADGGMHHAAAEPPKGWWLTYKPILLIGTYITGITLLLEFTAGGFHTERWMPNFMAAFFLTFSFFKMLDLKGFAESYSTYDIIAHRWMGWGYIYPFIELLLGIAFLLRFDPLLSNGIAFVVMTVSTIGVLKSVLNKRTIKCACLGAVFNLPMSAVTLIEDTLMIAMSGIMIIMIMN